MNKTRYILKIGTLAAALVFFLGVNGVVVTQVEAKCPKDCDCYWSSDCPGHQYCGDYFKCRMKGKLDGTCRKRATGAIWLRVNPQSVANAVDLYFQAYMEPITTGGGRPNEELLRAAQAVRLSRTWHKELQENVRSALDAVLGFDFLPPTPICPTDFGNISTIPDIRAALAIVEETRMGFVDAIVENNADVIESHIMMFWEEHPGYVPMHTGRCYPHGHPEFVISPEACQIAHLKAILWVLLEGREGR